MVDCKDHQKNIIKLGDRVAFTRANVVYIGKVIKIHPSLNPQVEYSFIDFRGKKCNYKYTPTHYERYILLESEG